MTVNRIRRSNPGRLFVVGNVFGSENEVLIFLTNCDVGGMSKPDKENLTYDHSLYYKRFFKLSATLQITNT